MSSLNALNVAIEAAERKRDAARTAMLERQSARQAAQAQMDQARLYSRDAGPLGRTGGLGRAARVMHHQYQFMERLQHAIGLQTRVVADQDIRLETARQALLAAELRVTSLQKWCRCASATWPWCRCAGNKRKPMNARPWPFRRSLGLQFQEA